MTPLDPSIKVDRAVEQAIKQKKHEYPPKVFNLSFGQTVVFAGQHMVLCDIAGGVKTPAGINLNSLQARAILEFTKRGLVAHSWDPLFHNIEHSLEKLDPRKLRIKEIRKPGTLPKKTFTHELNMLHGSRFRTREQRDLDAALLQQEGIYHLIYDTVLGKLADMDLKGKMLLDAGCGKGLLIKKITQAHPELRVYGIEYFPENVKDARRQLRQAKRDDIDVVDRIRCGDAKDLRSVFPDIEKFDGIISTGLISHQVSSPRNARKIIRQWSGMLNSGDPVLTAGFTPIVLDPQDFEAAGFGILGMTIPENIFQAKQPKEFFHLERV